MFDIGHMFDFGRNEGATKQRRHTALLLAHPDCHTFITDFSSIFDLFPLKCAYVLYERPLSVTPHFILVANKSFVTKPQSFYEYFTYPTYMPNIHLSTLGFKIICTLQTMSAFLQFRKMFFF
jgi:hypothetical protein